MPGTEAPCAGLPGRRRPCQAAVRSSPTWRKPLSH